MREQVIIRVVLVVLLAVPFAYWLGTADLAFPASPPFGNPNEEWLTATDRPDGSAAAPSPVEPCYPGAISRCTVEPLPPCELASLKEALNLAYDQFVRSEDLARVATIYESPQALLRARAARLDEQERAHRAIVRTLRACADEGQ